MATRRERVVLELEDNFTTGMARAAASAALLNRELDSLSKDSVRTRRSLSDIDRPVQGIGRSADGSSKQVDKLSGRMRILADAAAVLGPSLIPVGAIGVPAVTGLAAQLGFAATAAGTAVLAFQGIGGALKTMNAAALDPTQQNLEKAQTALEGLAPAAQGFVLEVGRLLPQLKQLRDVAAGGLFPGLTEGLDAMVTALPHVQGIVAAVSTELGHISLNIGESLASDRWTSFLDFIAQQAPTALEDMAKAAAHAAHAVASLVVATNPLNQDFSKWLVQAATGVDRWATSLSKTQGFADFLNYVQTTGPKVAEAFGAIANAVVQIVQAASPLGGPVLDGVKALADVVSAIAGSDLGTPIFVAVGALALFNRTLGLMKVAGGTAFGGFIVSEAKAAAGIRTMIADLQALKRETRLITLPGAGFIGPLTRAETAAQRLRASLPALGRTAAALGGLAVAASGAADSVGLTNLASLGLIGSLGGPVGAVIGSAVGATIDFKHANDDLEGAIRRVNVAAREGDFSAIKQAAVDLQRMRDDASHTSGVGDFLGDTVKNIGFGITHPGQPFAFSSGRRDRIDNALADANLAAAATKATAAQKILALGFLGTAAGIDKATQAAEGFHTELDRLNEALTGRASIRDYEQSLDDFTKRAADRAKVLSDIRQAQQAAATAKTPAEKAAAEARLKDLQAQAAALRNTLDINTQAGRDTQAALDNIASTALKVAQTLSGPQQATFLDAARADFIKAATAAGMTKKAAKALADEVLGLKNVTGRPRIVIDANGAWHVIDQTAARLERLTRKTYKLNIKAQAGAIIPQVLDAQAHAAGGTVRGPRYPYGDKVLAFLAPGEEVITNRRGEADRFRADRAAQRIPAYADGGMVGRSFGAAQPGGPLPVRFSDQDIDRIAGALAAARPNHGDVHINGDPTVYRREMQAARRRSSSDGYRRVS